MKLTPNFKLLYSATLVVCLHLSPFPAQAALVLVDVGNGQGTPTAPDTNGNYWNLLATTNSPLALTTDDNLVSGWELTLGVTSTSSTYGFTGPGLNAGATGAPEDFAVTGAYNDAWFDNQAGGNTVTFSFSGLNPVTTYTLTLWGSRAPNGTPWTNGAVSVSNGSAAGGPDFTLLNGALGNSLVLTVTPNASGVLSFTFDRASGSGSGAATGLNAMSLQSVPEPATVGLCLLGITGMALLRRQRQSA